MPDLSSFNTKRAEQGVKMPVRHPIDDTPMVDEKTKEPVTITLLGRDCAEYKTRAHNMANKRISLSQSRGMKVKIDAAEMEQESLEMLVSLTKGWKHIVWEGKELPCNAENATMVYTNLPWLREQVDEFIGQRSNFLGN